MPLTQNKKICRIGAEDIRKLRVPLADSHKGQNGKLLIIGGSERFHGAPLLAAKVASKIVDLVYFSSVPENNQLVHFLKSRLCEFIAVPWAEVDRFASKVDAILLGPGLGRDDEARKLVQKLMDKYPKKTFVIDADALYLLKKSALHRRCILTPHKGEFRQVFDLSPTKAHVAAAARKYGCIIVLKGRHDIVASPKQIRLNVTGNAGMTKGGTGDVLAGLTAALVCKNDPFLGACAAVFINGFAGDRLKERYSIYFNASDLVAEIPRTIRWSQTHS